MNDRVNECIHSWIGKTDNDLKNAELVHAARDENRPYDTYVFTVSTAGFLLMRRYGNQVMTNCCHLWWTCGPCKAYAAEPMADFLREHQNERGIARGWLSEYGLS